MTLYEERAEWLFAGEKLFSRRQLPVVDPIPNPAHTTPAPHAESDEEAA